MKPIKCWVAQDIRTKECRAFGKKPTIDSYGDWNAGLYGDIIAKNRLDKSPARCVIISEEEYNALLTSQSQLIANTSE